MMKPLRIVIAIVVVAASAIGFAAWLKSRTPATSPDAAQSAPPAATPSDESLAAAELDLLQQKLSAVIQHKRNPAAVLDEARALVGRYPDSASAHVTLAQVAAIAGLQQEALDHLAKSLELNPNQPETHDFAGSLALRLGDHTAAQRHFSQAMSLMPAEPKYRLHLAAAQLKADRFDEARQSILQALRTDSSSYQAYGLLSDLYAQQNKVDQALDAINRALELAGDKAEYRDPYMRRKSALLRRGNRPDEALAVLRQLPAKRWLERDVADEFAQTYMLMNRPEKAAEHYEAILPLDPLADWAAEKAAQYHLKANQRPEAQRALDTLRRINPHAPSIPELEAALR